MSKILLSVPLLLFLLTRVYLVNCLSGYPLPYRDNIVYGRPMAPNFTAVELYYHSFYLSILRNSFVHKTLSIKPICSIFKNLEPSPWGHHFSDLETRAKLSQFCITKAYLCLTLFNNESSLSSSFFKVYAF